MKAEKIPVRIERLKKAVEQKRDVIGRPETMKARKKLLQKSLAENADELEMLSATVKAGKE